MNETPSNPGNSKHTTRVIPQTIFPFSHAPINGAPKRRVAAYARVSTDSDEQQTSYDMQIRYYTQHIYANSDWVFAGLYSDEGISGLTTKHRDGFNRMIQDALDGKIDLILTKSISRFARNTLDTLRISRELKAAGVEIHFEKENLFTFDTKSELILTILSSLSQEESRSISQNVTWSVRKRFAEGKFSLAYSRFLGYTKGPDGKLAIVEEEAQTVRLIYSLFLQGHTVGEIAKHLTEAGLPTPAGKEKWHIATVNNILTNEKYRGDALLQKSFTPDYLEKRTRINRGEVDQYLHIGTHPAIIDPQEFDRVQIEIERRKILNRSYSNASGFGGRIICGDCGSLYGAKVWHSNRKYRKIIWRCNHKYDKGRKPCASPNLNEDDVKRAFVDTFNRMLTNKKTIIAACREAIDVLINSEGLEDEHDRLTVEVESLTKQIRNHVNKNLVVAQDQHGYMAEYERMASEYRDLEARINSIELEVAERQDRCTELNAYVDTMEQVGEMLREFDSYLWNATVDTVIARADKSLEFHFKDGRVGVWQ